MSLPRLTRCLAVAGAACALGLAVAGPASATDGNSSWVSAPAVAPAPPTGASPAPYPLPVGYVGDIEFWAPNRGVLITAGAGAVSAGLFAYDGSSWHQLSTVCGGTDGRIAWTGPEEFWTIADQRPGQTLPSGGSGALADVSLCHFLNGQVVGSYALPLDEPNSYQPMNAAACSSPSNCWFGGNLDSNGAFHLWWNGSTLVQVDGPEDHRIASMTVNFGQIYESVQLGPHDAYTGETPATTPLLHVIDPSQANPFSNLFPTPAGCTGLCPVLPVYGTDAQGNPVDPLTLGGLALSSDWSTGAADPALWAVGGYDGRAPRGQQGAAHPVVLFYKDGGWTQVVPNLTTFANGDSPVASDNITPAARSAAAEPSSNAAWIAVVPANPNGGNSFDGQAHVDRLAMTGSGSATVTDDDTLGIAQGVGPRGNSSAVACPAAQDCWLATDQGWLFHLTDGTQLPTDTDPNFAGVIAHRPPDSGVPVVSLNNASPDTLPTTTTAPPPFGSGTTIRRRRHVKPIVTHVGTPVLRGLTLELPITVRVRVRVQLIARRGHLVVARSRSEIFGPGRHIIRIVLNRAHYPTGLSIDARPAGRKR